MSGVRVWRQFQGTSDVRTFHGLEDVSHSYLFNNRIEKLTTRFHNLISVSQFSCPQLIPWKYVCCQYSKTNLECFKIDELIGLTSYPSACLDADDILSVCVGISTGVARALGLNQVIEVNFAILFRIPL